MQKLLITALLWAISLILLLYIEWKSFSNNELKNNEYIQNINSFSWFWQIKLSKPFKNINTIWYKIENFDKENKIYTFEYKFLSITWLILPFEPKIYGKVLFDNLLNIKNLQAIIWDQYLVQFEIETGSIWRLSLTQIWQPTPIFSKLLDLKDINFDFFLIYSLPYQNLEENKIYSYKIIDIQKIYNDQISTKEIYISKIAPNKYKLKTKDNLEYTIIFKNNLPYQIYNPIISQVKIENTDIQKQIYNQINKIKNHNIKQKNTTTITKNKKNTHSTQILEKKNQDIIQKSKNLNIQNIIQQLKQEKQVKYCPIISR